MPHYAKIENGIVTQVIVAEALFVGALSGTWIQTSFNTRAGIHYGSDGEPDNGLALRANYAGIGYIYDDIDDAFYAPQPYPSWTLAKPAYQWEAPVPYPEDGKRYSWNEDTLSWDEII